MGASQSRPAAMATLTSASARADLATLEAILPDTPLAYLATGDKADGWTPLHFAAGGGAASPFPLSSSSSDPSADAIALLLSYGAPANKADRRGRTPLHVAAMTGNAPAAGALLRGGRRADPDVRDRDGLTPLMAAAAVGGGEALRALLAAGASAKASLKVRVCGRRGAASAAGARARPPLGGEGKVVASSPTSSFHFFFQDGTTPLHLAAHRGDTACIAALLAAGANPGARDAEGRTPLHEAGGAGAPAAAVAALLAAGADPRAQDAEGRSPAAAALRAGHGRLATTIADAVKLSSAPGWWASAGGAGAGRAYPSPADLAPGAAYPTAALRSAALSPEAAAVTASARAARALAAEKAADRAQAGFDGGWGDTDPAALGNAKFRPPPGEDASAGWDEPDLPPDPLVSRVTAALAALATLADASKSVGGVAADLAAKGAVVGERVARGAAAAGAAAVAAALAPAGVAQAGPVGAATAVPLQPRVAAATAGTAPPPPAARAAAVVAPPSSAPAPDLRTAAVAGEGPAGMLTSSSARAGAAVPAPPAPALPTPRHVALLEPAALAAITHGFTAAARLGAGGRGVAYVGTLADGTPVAVKVLDPRSAPPPAALVAAVDAAAGAAKASSSGRVRPPLAVCPAARAVVVELADGGTLDVALRGGGLKHGRPPAASSTGVRPPPRLSWGDRLAVAADLAEGLAALHARGGASHGGLRPSAVLLERVLSGGGAGTALRAFISPDGLDGLFMDEPPLPSPSLSPSPPAAAAPSPYARPVPGGDAAADDTYALGVTLLQLLSGREAGGLVAAAAAAPGGGPGGADGLADPAAGTPPPQGVAPALVALALAATTGGDVAAMAPQLRALQARAAGAEAEAARGAAARRAAAAAAARLEAAGASAAAASARASAASEAAEPTSPAAVDDLPAVPVGEVAKKSKKRVAAVV